MNQNDAVIRSPTAVLHRNDEYDESSFFALHAMQERHFWYRGRHRFLLEAVDRHLFPAKAPAGSLRAVDLGGGCGGWVKFLSVARETAFAEIGLADSSMVALELAGAVVGPRVRRYQVDLMNLPWQAEWDAAFLLDVIEHVREDAAVLRQVLRALKPGGLLFVTVPALMAFWTVNDDVAQHLRRYSTADAKRLAAETGFELLDARYFMFFLSPLLMASRLLGSASRPRTHEEIVEYNRRNAKIPSAPANGLLGAVFSAESPLGHWIRFPWGTSMLAVFRRSA